MSNLQIIEEQCRIIELQNRIITAQAAALEQVGAIVMEEERAEAARAYERLIGNGELPDDSEGTA